MPLHLTLKLRKLKLNLRSREVLKAVKTAAAKAQAFGLNVIHFSILHDHVHLIAEAKDNQALERGMKSFSGRLGKHLAKLLGGGPVWKGRFHLHVLNTPTEMKNALRYVLLNFSKHENLVEHLDYYSSARVFGDWRKLVGNKYSGLLKTLRRVDPAELGLSPPRSWLCAIGWTCSPS